MISYIFNIKVFMAKEYIFVGLFREAHWKCKDVFKFYDMVVSWSRLTQSSSLNDQVSCAKKVTSAKRTAFCCFQRS